MALYLNLPDRVIRGGKNNNKNKNKFKSRFLLQKLEEEIFQLNLENCCFLYLLSS